MLKVERGEVNRNFWKFNRGVVLFFSFSEFNDIHDVNILIADFFDAFNKNLDCWMSWNTFIQFSIETFKWIVSSVYANIMTIFVFCKSSMSIDQMRYVP